MSVSRGIIFSPASVRAILLGHKVVTRRTSARWDKAVPGDTLWVREPYALCYANHWPDLQSVQGHDKVGADCWAFYAATFDRAPPTWRTPMFMPRWASRLTLEVVSVRAEPLQAMERARDDLEAALEGYPTLDAFRAAWDSINPRSPWSSNPEVRRIEFRML